MLGREAKIPTSYLSKVSKEGADFVNKVIVVLLRCCKEPLVKDWAIMALVKS